MRELPQHYGTEILRAEVGSTLHGTGLGVAHEDHDEMGVFVEHMNTTIGLGRLDHYQWRTKAEGEKSGPGDTDLVCYTLRRWCSLALKGNPSVLLPLYAPEDKLVVVTDLGRDLRTHRDWFASKRAGRAFLGYMEQQRQRLTGERSGSGRIRKNLEEGVVDWKYAMHMLRLGYQGVEYLSTGAIRLPVPGALGDYLRAVRQGLHPLDEVLRKAEQLEVAVKELLATVSPLPEEPETDKVEAWVIQAHLWTWHYE